MTVPSVVDPTEEAAGSARPATSEPTEVARVMQKHTETLSDATKRLTPTSAGDGSITGRNGSESESPTSRSSERQRSVSNRRWRQPRTVREFAAQLNAMATAVLNGELEGQQLDSARLYANLARTIAQAMTTEVQRARFLRQAPDLTFDEPDDESGSR